MYTYIMFMYIIKNDITTALEHIKEFGTSSIERQRLNESLDGERIQFSSSEPTKVR